MPSIPFESLPSQEARQVGRSPRFNTSPKIKTLLKNCIALFIGCILAFAVLEIFLILYNPVESRVKGNKIRLPINKQYMTVNRSIDKLDRVIVHTKNSLGFRGEDPPREFHEFLSLIAIGGSTTECKYLSDGKTWMDILLQNLSNDFNHLWVNNAGLDGHSTFGHIVLLDEYLSYLKPKVALFLVGLNDKGRSDIGPFDLQYIKGRIDLSSIRGFIKSVSSHSETFSLLLNGYRYYRARTIGLSHREIDLTKIDSIDLSEVVDTPNKDMIKYIQYYRERLSQLIHIAKRNDIDPILLTQPALFGKGIDDVTGADLARIRVGHMDGWHSWNVLEEYNEATREIARNENILVIDLAREVPKSSLYFYDFYHFTNEGARKVGEILYHHLSPYLKAKYHAYTY